VLLGNSKGSLWSRNEVPFHTNEANEELGQLLHFRTKLRICVSVLEVETELLLTNQPRKKKNK